MREVSPEMAMDTYVKHEARRRKYPRRMLPGGYRQGLTHAITAPLWEGRSVALNLRAYLVVSFSQILARTTVIAGFDDDRPHDDLAEPLSCRMRQGLGRRLCLHCPNPRLLEFCFRFITYLS